MAFQRSYSKVWWDSDSYQNVMPTTNNTTSATTYNNFMSMPTTKTANRHPFYNYQSHQQQEGQQYHSIDYHNLRDFTVNLSGIQEVDDEPQHTQQQQHHHQQQEANLSKLCWGDKRLSPGSLRSQDSGFSDNDESPKINNTTPESPVSEKSYRAVTPPTVIRRVGKSHFYSPLVNVSRRISFSNNDLTTNNEPESEPELTETVQKQKRRRRVCRKLGQTLKDLTKYHNETVNLDTFITTTHNDATSTKVSLTDSILSLQTTAPHTSTPNSKNKENSPTNNRHTTPALENWLFELRATSEPEVLSTLQTKI